MWRGSFRPIRWRSGPLPKNPTRAIFWASLLVVAIAGTALFLLVSVLRLFGL